MKIQTLAQKLLFSTVRLETRDVEDRTLATGTSFIVGREFPDHGEELFLVTNKHVVAGAFTGYFFFTQEKDGDAQIGTPFVLRTDDFQGQFHGHPRADVDLAVMPLSWHLDLVATGGVRPYVTKILAIDIASAEFLDTLDVIRTVLFIGYPNGLFDQRNYTPIVRQGITATPIQLDFNGCPQFLIDASVFPGSSGSPVFVYEETWKGNLTDPRLVGVLAAVFTQASHGRIQMVPAPTQLIPLPEFDQMIDVGVVLKAHLITEAIEDFWETHKHLARRHGA